ncbi:MAG: mechanosensitive ion channel family protein [Caulobacteraceae bacterium]
MIQLTTTPASPPSDYSFNTFAQQVEDFVRGVLSLDPQQALLRAGLSFLVLLGAMILIWGLHLILKSLIERIAPKEVGALTQRHLHIGRWTMRVARIAIFVGVLIVILRLWGFDFSDLRDSPIYAMFAVLGRIAIILVLALAAVEFGQLGINRLFNRVAKRARNPRRAAQIRTLGPVLSGLATTIVVIIAAMMALSEVGVEIGPLLAGAGIIGLAVGFGAQTIVKDFLTGLFLIMEDSVSIGDVVKIGEFGGAVEAMSLRTIKLRAFDGTLHVFPYSEAQVIHNQSKDFSFAVFDLPLDHNSDIAKALDLMKEIGDEVRAEPAFAGIVVSPIEIAGVDRLSETGVLLKARIRTAPGKQWTVQREYLRRLRLAFEREGIEFSQTTTRMIVPEPPASSRRGD